MINILPLLHAHTTTIQLATMNNLNKYATNHKTQKNKGEPKKKEEPYIPKHAKKEDKEEIYYSV